MAVVVYSIYNPSNWLPFLLARMFAMLAVLLWRECCFVGINDLMIALRCTCAASLVIVSTLILGYVWALRRSLLKLFVPELSGTIKSSDHLLEQFFLGCVGLGVEILTSCGGSLYFD